MHWIGNGEVVAKGEVDYKDPKALVHHMLLGPDCWRVWVKKIIGKHVPLYRATSDLHILEDALETTVACPKKYIMQ